LRDVTTRRLAEERLRQAQKMEAVGRLTAGIAHDFNNLLTVALGNLELLDRTPLSSGKPKRLIEATLSALTRAERLTAQLLAFSRRQRLEPSPLNINQVLVGLEDLLKRAIGARIEMAFTLRSRLPPAWADRNQLETALLNVASNARDAMPNGGRFILETGIAEIDAAFAREHPDATPGRYVTIVAADTGEGMPPHVLRRAFEPFFSTKETGKGTGLGLAMVYGFARQSGGHVTIESQPRRGTRVTIFLPLAARQQTADSTAPQASAGLKTGTETVLVVEDDAEVRALACAMLADLGYRTVEACNAEMALRMLKTRPEIDLVFSDIVMPGTMSGLDLARHVMARRPGLPIILTSGYNSRHSDPDRILSLVGFVPKPYHQADLSSGLRKALESSDRHT
jgi:nitrogen-specific signal transduction histidine kinase/CheY-like chemotaxis protein